MGLPAVGKSTVGRRLARDLGYTFADCDALLEQRLQCRIRDFFETEGEAKFRDAESAMLEELVAGADAVIATGGGIVLRPANRELLRQRTMCVYLKADPEALFHRLRRDTKRPLLQVADPAARLSELSAERDPLYREAATLEIETRGKSLQMLVDAIVHALPSASAVGRAAGASS
ncbi:MAG: shikimate kinase [Burkholderiales bacterium]|nr:shikimate kinase [Burkholderiales bacterium]